MRTLPDFVRRLRLAGAVACVASGAAACGSRVSPYTFRAGEIRGPNSLHAAIAEFVIASGGHGLDVTTRIVGGPGSGLAAGDVGLCMYGSDDHPPLVRLLSDYWFAHEDGTGAPTEEQWALVMHEYGHCALGRPHLDAIDPDQCPVSVMRWEISSAADCLRRGLRTRADYLNELLGVNR